MIEQVPWSNSEWLANFYHKSLYNFVQELLSHPVPVNPYVCIHKLCRIGKNYKSKLNSMPTTTKTTYLAMQSNKDILKTLQEPKGTMKSYPEDNGDYILS